MKKVLQIAITTVLVFAFLDLAILFTGLAQIAFEGRTGYWNPFWSWQAEHVVRLLQHVSN